MKAKILLLFSCLILSVGVFASVQTQELDLTTFTTYGTSTYDNPSSQTFTANSWAGIHKWYGESSPFETTGYTQLILELPSTQPQKVLLKVDYTDGTSYKVVIPTTSTIGVLELDATPIKDIIINNYSSTDGVTIALSRLYLSGEKGKAVLDDIYSGTTDHENWKWNNRVVLASSNFADAEAGSRITVEYTLGSDVSMEYPTSYQYKFHFAVDEYLSSNAADLNASHILGLESGSNHYTFTLNATDAARLKTDGFYISGYNIKTQKVTLINYYNTYAIEKVLESGSVDMAWSDQWNQPADIISSLQVGDVMKITASGRNYDANVDGLQWPQAHISWDGTGDGKSVSQGFWNISEFPHVWSHTLTADEVTAIKAANNLALRGNNVTVTKWTLTQTNVMSRDDETASSANTVIWEGSQEIDWSCEGCGKYLQISGSTLTSLSAGQELRFHYTGTSEDNRQAGAIYNWGNEYILDGGTWRSLDKGASCFVYTLSADNVTNIQSHNLIVSGTGITLTKIEAYTPLAVQTISNDITLSGENIVLNDVSVSTSGTLTVANTVQCYDLSINAANGASAQVINPNNLTVNGKVYFDLQLDPSGTVNTNQWYAFSVPFQADVTAIQGKRGGAYVALTEGFANDYLVLYYNGSGWAEQHSGNLTPGNLYMIGLNPSVNDLRFVKSSGNIQGDASISLSAGWNALGNTQVRHVDASAEGLSYVQVYNSASDNYTTCALNTTSFVVGSAFFAQTESAGTLTLGDASHSVLKAPRHAFSTSDSRTVLLQIAGDNLFVEVSDDAEDTYIIGRDLHKLGNLTSARTPLMWAEAYDDKLCAVNIRETNGVAEVPVSFYSPANGTQTITLMSDIEDGVSINILHDGAVVCNFDETDSQTMALNKGANTGYVLRISEKAKVPTDITNISAEMSAKRYDILGREVNADYRGIVIENGKKILCY